MSGILVVVDDLIFLAKIQQTAKLIGVAVEAVSPGQLEARLAQAPPRAVILDLNHRSGSALEVVRKLKSSDTTTAVPVVGFLSHVQGELAVAARAAGCDVVLARSAFTRDLPQLLKQYGSA
ncbi:MAG TPA: response regulator [Terriglobia bacterium]|nr:response regulator [Terriglobia bacterium]